MIVYRKTGLPLHQSDGPQLTSVSIGTTILVPKANDKCVFPVGILAVVRYA